MDPIAAPGAPLASPVAGGLTPAQIEATRAAAREFEAMAVGQLLQPMFETIDTSKGLFGGGAGEATWRPLLVDEMAKMLAKTGKLGIADNVLKEMLRMQEAGHE